MFNRERKRERADLEQLERLAEMSSELDAVLRVWQARGIDVVTQAVTLKVAAMELPGKFGGGAKAPRSVTGSLKP